MSNGGEESDFSRLLSEASHWADWFNHRKQLSEQALENVPNWGRWFFALTGSTLVEDQEVIIPDFLSIRRLRAAPSLTDIFSTAAQHDQAALEAARVVDKISCELVLNFNENLRSAQTLSYYACLAISIKTGKSFSVPIICNQSFDSIASARAHSVRYQVTNDPIKLWMYETHSDPIETQSREIANGLWSLISLHKVNQNRRLHVATQAYWTWPQTSDPRLAMMAVWGGLDAMFGKNERQAKKGIVSRISDFVESFHESDVLELYEARCDAVHGRDCRLAYLIEGVQRSAEMLRHSLDQVTKLGKQPLPDEGT